MWQGVGQGMWFLADGLDQSWTRRLRWASPVPFSKLCCRRAFPAPLGRGSPRREEKANQFLQGHLKLLNTHKTVLQTFLPGYRAFQEQLNNYLSVVILEKSLYGSMRWHILLWLSAPSHPLFLTFSTREMRTVPLTSHL